VPVVLKSGSLNLLEPSGPVQACNGIALPLPCIKVITRVIIPIIIIIIIIVTFCTLGRGMWRVGICISQDLPMGVRGYCTLKDRR